MQCASKKDLPLPPRAIKATDRGSPCSPVKSKYCSQLSSQNEMALCRWSAHA